MNKTSSAIRITHLPTGVVVTCQDERSQLQNRAKAMAKLKAILAARAEEEREAELHKIAGGRQAQVGWGSQIRSYVLQPYQLVKDLRTDHEVGQRHRRARRRPRRLHGGLPPLEAGQRGLSRDAGSTGRAVSSPRP